MRTVSMPPFLMMPVMTIRLTMLMITVALRHTRGTTGSTKSRMLAWVRARKRAYVATRAVRPRVVPRATSAAKAVLLWLRIASLMSKTTLAMTSRRVMTHVSVTVTRARMAAYACRVRFARSRSLTSRLVQSTSSGSGAAVTVTLPGLSPSALACSAGAPSTASAASAVPLPAVGIFARPSATLPLCGSVTTPSIRRTTRGWHSHLPGKAKRSYHDMLGA